MLASNRADVPLSESRRSEGWPIAAGISIPAAIVLAPLLVGLVDELFPAASRLRGRLAIIILSALLLGAASKMLLKRRESSTAAILFSMLAALGWTVAAAIDHLPPLYWESATREHTADWVLIVFLAAVASIAVSQMVKSAAQLARFIAISSSLVMAALFLAQLAPQYLDRRYTIREASANIGDLLGEVGPVLSDSAESIFLANRLKYTTDAHGNEANYLIIAFDRRNPDEHRGQRKIATYPLYRHPDFSRFNPNVVNDPALSEPSITIYDISEARK